MSALFPCLSPNNILLPVNISKIAGRDTNIADPDQTPRSAASDLGLLCLLRHIRVKRVKPVQEKV